MTLPNRRESRSGVTEFKGQKLHVTVGFYPKGHPREDQPGDIFAFGFKSGSDQQAERDQTCMLWSKLMQKYNFTMEDFLPYVARDIDGNRQTLSGAALDYAIENLATL